MDFSEAASAQLAGRTVRMARLLRLDFLSGTARYWPGHTDLPTGGHTWTATHGLLSMGAIVASSNGSAPEQTFTLSGVDPVFVAKAQAAKAEYYNRMYFIHLQFFDADWQVLDGPVPIAWGRMRSLVAGQVPDEEGFIRTITLTGETLFVSRGRPRRAYYTDRDQQARYPGDKGMERTVAMQSKTLNFPQL